MDALMSDLVVLPVEEIDTGEETFVRHIPCCHDESIALCGRKLSSGGVTKYPKGVIPPDACTLCVQDWYDSCDCPLIGQCYFRYVEY